METEIYIRQPFKRQCYREDCPEDAGKYIARFKEGDYSAFDAFYALTSKKVYLVAVSILRNRSEAEDIVQETYVSFLENIAGFKKGADVFAYLTVIARNKSINVYNGNKRLSYDEKKIYSSSHGTDISNLEAEEILALLKDARDREIITYHVIMGYKFREIAEMTGLPLGTVLWRYNRALKFLAKGVKINEA